MRSQHFIVNVIFSKFFSKFFCAVQTVNDLLFLFFFLVFNVVLGSSGVVSVIFIFVLATTSALLANLNLLLLLLYESAVESEAFPPAAPTRPV